MCEVKREFSTPPGPWDDDCLPSAAGAHKEDGVFGDNLAPRDISIDLADAPPSGVFSTLSPLLRGDQLGGSPEGVCYRITRVLCGASCRGRRRRWRGYADLMNPNFSEGGIWAGRGGWMGRPPRSLGRLKPF